ncbi:hypothetical protein FRB93_003058 [Tulasnella sp. JGI-2019a]|nr:hypothetical protein FRB93_003058 [Tulasnella sp. JGI-2019a]
MLSSSNPLSSSHAFIRALKAKDEERSKIDLATAAWNDRALYIPGKNVVLVEWIFQQLSDDRNKSIQDHLLIDTRYWALLDQIISADNPKTCAVWLTPVMGQRHILPILSSFILRIPMAQNLSIVELVTRVFQTLLPLATRKATADHLSDCLWNSIHSLSSLSAETLTPSVETLLTLIIETFVAAFSQTKFDKKKCLAQFLRSHLGEWFTILANTNQKCVALLKAIRNAGLRILFSNEGIRSVLDVTSAPSQNGNSSNHHLMQSISVLLSAQALGHARSEILLQIPELLESFILAIQRDGANLSSVPGLGATDAARIKAATLSFVSQCLDGPLSLKLSDTPIEPLEQGILEARVILWGILEKHGEVFDVNEEKTLGIIIAEVESALSAVTKSPLVTATLMDLDCMLRMRFESVEPFMLRIFAELAICSDLDHKAANRFLSTSLDYHSKTRTINSFIATLTDCIVKFDFGDQPHDVYDCITLGPLFSMQFCHKLQFCVSTFLTPTQITEVISRTKDILIAAWHKLNLVTTSSTTATTTKPKKKKRRIDTIQMDDDTSIPSKPEGRTVVTFAVLCRFFSLLLQAMALNSLGPQYAGTVQQDLMEIFESLIGAGGLAKIIGEVQRIDNRVPHPPQLALLSILRLQYSFQRSFVAWNSERSHDSGNHSSVREVLALGRDDVVALQSLLSGERILPDLRIEIVRSLMHAIEWSEASPLDHAMLLLDTMRSTISFIRSPADQGHHEAISTEGQSSAITLWNIVLTRWLHIIDNHANEETLLMLAEALIWTLSWERITLEQSQSSKPTLKSVTQEVLGSAHFWESRGVRRALLACITRRTAKLGEFTASERIQLLSASAWTAQKLEYNELGDLTDDFSILLHFPSDYLTKASRAEFVRRALALDVAITHWNRVSPAQYVAEWWTILRTFVGRVMRDTASYDFLVNAPDVMIYLGEAMSIDETIVMAPSWWSRTVGVTLDLLDMGNRTGVRAITDDPKSCMEISLEALAKANPFSCGLARTHVVIPRGWLLSLTEVIIEGRTYSSLPTNFLRLLATTHAVMGTWIDSRCKDVLVSGVAVEVEELIEFIEASRISVRYCGWCALEFEPSKPRRDVSLVFPPIIGRIRHLSPSSDLKELCVSFTSLTLATLICQAGSMDGEVAQFIAPTLLVIRVLLSKEGATEIVAAVTTTLGKSTKTWPLETYTEAVRLLQVHLSDLRGPQEPLASSLERLLDIVALLRLSDVLLRYAPDGTYSVAQPLVTSWFAFLAGESGLRPVHEDLRALTNCRLLTFEVLAFLDGLISERATSLNNLELTYIWPILSTVLSPNTASPGSTSLSPRSSTSPSSSSIFTTLTNILISMIRQRRELLSNHLPNFTHILCLMMSSLRSLRDTLGSQKVVLGAKTVEVARIGLPWWISLNGGHYELTDNDAKAFGRVLTTLTTKTVGREGFGGAGKGRRGVGKEGSHKSESLAPVFSRHAAFVLIAYLKTITDSNSSGSSRSGGAASAGVGLLTTLSRPTREALEEGVYTLCGLVGDHGRSWVLQSLNADGRVVLKSLWAEYEKQRYAGMG